LHELKGKDGFAPLHLAAKEGNLHHVQYLLRANPETKVMARDDIGMLPISLACMGNHISVIKELLLYNGKEQLEDSQQGSAVFFACMTGRLGILQILFHTAKVLGANLLKVLLIPTPLSQLLRTKFVSNENDLEIPLHITIYSPNINDTIRPALVDILLSVAPNEQLEYQRKVDHQSALHISIDANITPVMKKLIAQTNAKQYLLKDDNGCTAFMFALENNKKEQAELLFKHGPAEQYAMPNKKGTHALIHVMRLNLIQIFEAMISRMTTEELITVSDQNDPLLHMSLLRPAMLNLLLKTESKGALLNSRDKKFGNTALHSALNCDFEEEVIRSLLIHGIEVNAQDNNGWSAIHIVCSKNNAKYFNLLCPYQTSFNICTITGETPLHIAAANGHVTMVKSLLHYRVDPNPCNKSGLTPLFLAVFFGHIPVVEILLQNKANPNQQILSNFTALKLALYKLNSKLIYILLKYGADINQIISTDPLQSFKNYILAQANNGNTFCQKVKLIMIELHLIPSDYKPLAPTLSDEKLPSEDLGVSARSYLKELGFTIEQILDIEDARRYKLTKRNPHEFKYQEAIKNEEAITWLNGAVLSNASFILPISSHSVLAFCYFDELTLAQQGCDPTKIERKRLKFDGYHIKELDKSKKIYTETIKLNQEDSEKQITYTHELKVTAVDRILLFQISSDKPVKTNKGLCYPSLYIGLRFVPGGFHTNASIKSFTESIAMTSASKCLVVQWPSLARLECTSKSSV
jgi:ankyrin repeat protein